MAGARMIGVVLAVVAVAFAGQMAKADDHELYEFCRKVDFWMPHNHERDVPVTAQSSYEAAMQSFKSLSALLSPERRRLADAWRAVTFDEACSPKSLAYVHSINACQPSTNEHQKHLHADARKYAEKCLTSEYLEEKWSKFAGSEVEKFLNNDFLAAYRAANPNERPVHLGAVFGDNCCKPDRADKALAATIEKDFPEEAKQFKEASDKVKAVGSFLNKHLYKPCTGYEKRVDTMMDEAEAAAYYGYQKDITRLPQSIQDGMFRFKICENLKYDEYRVMFTERVASHF